MKLVTYLPRAEQGDPVQEMYRPRAALGRGGVLLNNRVYDLAGFALWAKQTAKIELNSIPQNLLDYLNLELNQQQALRELASQLTEADVKSFALDELRLRAPLELPPSIRDFYAFEQHVNKARANRGLGMIPEWYELAVFYFTNHRAVYGAEDFIPYPRNTAALDIELEIACVIGKAGRDIRAEEAGEYIAGYMIMNDWTARDLQMQEMKINMGPAKGKDFATSFGPWLVTTDELAEYRRATSAAERYNMTMLARLNGKEISRGNFNDIYYSFPQMIERASMNTWLVPGDILGSGTVGTGCLLEQGDQRERWLLPGDVIELEIEGLGILRNSIAGQR